MLSAMSVHITEPRMVEIIPEPSTMASFSLPSFIPSIASHNMAEVSTQR